MKRHFRRTSGGKRGFSLMELLVVLGIFSTVVTAATDIFIMSNRSQRKIFALERTQADARFTMETMAREIRTGALDYDYYGATLEEPGPVDELALVDSTGKKIRFHKSSDTGLCADAVSLPCLVVSLDGGGSAAITPKGVRVFDAAFYLLPKSDPTEFNTDTGTYAADIQPHVTIVLIMESVVQDPRDRSVVYLQTTMENRGYKR